MPGIARGGRRRGLIRRGALGRDPAAGHHVAGSAACPEAARLELTAWEAQYGRAWVESLRRLADRAARAGVPIRAGSAGLLGSPAFRAWGWCGPESRGIGPAEWVLRVPPGWAERVRAWIEEETDRADRPGAPSILVEESPWAHLPVDASGPEPRPEAWSHARRLLGVRPGQRVPAGRAEILAWDVACAAAAWERRRGAWWLAARAAAGPGEERGMQERAADRGLRLLEPCVARSAACSSESGLSVRLGLDALGPRVAAQAEVIVRERERGGRFRSWRDFVRRVRRTGVGWRVVAELVVRNALRDLPSRTPVPSPPRKRAAVLAFPALALPETERRAACRLSCLSP